MVIITTNIYGTNYSVALYKHTGKENKISEDGHLMLVDFTKPNINGYACIIDFGTLNKPMTTTIDNVEKNYREKLEFNDLSLALKRAVVNYLHQCGEKYILDDFQKELVGR